MTRLLETFVANTSVEAQKVWIKNVFRRNVN